MIIKGINTIITISLIVLSIFLVSCNQTEKNNISSNPNLENRSKVFIFTDKSEYTKGELITVIVKNGLDKPIYYPHGGDRFWDIQSFREGEWQSSALEEGGGFQLTQEDLEEDCYIALYERMPPLKFESKSNISDIWDQKICPYGTESPIKPKKVKQIGSGRYRLIFTYGFNISEDNLYSIKDYKRIYSDDFIID